MHTGLIEQIFLIYWPERDTWNDSAPHTVGRNRTTFMRCVYCPSAAVLGYNVHVRYLTKLCDQVVALMSPEHAQAIVWNQHDEHGNYGASDNDIGSTRIVNCIVDRTTDQEESISARKSFQVCITPSLQAKFDDHLSHRLFLSKLFSLNRPRTVYLTRCHRSHFRFSERRHKVSWWRRLWLSSVGLRRITLLMI